MLRPEAADAGIDVGYVRLLDSKMARRQGGVIDRRHKIGMNRRPSQRAGEGRQKTAPSLLLHHQHAHHLAQRKFAMPLRLAAQISAHPGGSRHTQRMGLVAEGEGEAAGRRHVLGGCGKGMDGGHR